MELSPFCRGILFHPLMLYSFALFSSGFHFFFLHLFLLIAQVADFYSFFFIFFHFGTSNGFSKYCSDSLFPYWYCIFFFLLRIPPCIQIGSLLYSDSLRRLFTPHEAHCSLENTREFVTARARVIQVIKWIMSPNIVPTENNCLYLITTITKELLCLEINFR